MPLLPLPRGSDRQTDNGILTQVQNITNQCQANVPPTLPRGKYPKQELSTLISAFLPLILSHITSRKLFQPFHDLITATITQDKCKISCSFFAKYISLDDPDNDMTSQPDLMHSSALTNYKLYIHNILSGPPYLDPNKPSSPVDVPYLALNICTPELVPIFYWLFRISLFAATFSFL